MGGQFRRHHRHRNDQDPLSFLLGSQLQQGLVGPHRLRADIVDSATGLLDVEHADEIRDGVVDADGLTRRSHPLRDRHHGQPVGEIVDDTEARAAGANDYCRPEDRQVERPGLEHRFDLSAGGQMWREVPLVTADAAQIDHSADVGRRRPLAEPAGVCPVQLCKVLSRQRVDQVVSHVDAVTEPLQRRRIAEVTFEHLDSLREVRLACTPGESHNLMARGNQSVDQPAADEPGRTDDENSHQERYGPVFEASSAAWYRTEREGFAKESIRSTLL